MKYIIAIAGLILFLGCNSTSSSQDEPLYFEQWALHYDKAFYEAYNINDDAHIHFTKTIPYTGKGVKVAVIDIGFDVNHPEYRNNIIKTINSADGSENVACIGSEDCDHGTAVTGIIASNINHYGLRGVAPDVELVLIKLDLAGYVGDDEIIDALEYASKENVDIINNSWGTGEVSEVVKEKLKELANIGRDGKGIIIIFASGNQGVENNNDESMVDEVIGVGSTDEENLRAYYSDFGEGLDIMAPGGYTLGITTTYESNISWHSPFIRAEDYDRFMGTSASAPLVTGAVALLLEKNPSLTRAEVQNILRESADKIGNVDYIDGWNKYYGYGKLNVSKLLDF